MTARAPGVVYLGGGGSPADEAPLWRLMLPGHQRLLYWPFALPTDVVGDEPSWLRKSLSSLGLEAEVTMWSSLADHRPAELVDFDLLFVGGGNTFRLLHQVRAHGFVEAVREHVRRGGAYYGGSAGAILAMDSIEIAVNGDDNDVGMSDFAGLSLVPGFDLLPHYLPSQLDLARRWSSEHRRPVLGVPENAGLVWDGTALTAVGVDVQCVTPEVVRSVVRHD